MRNVSFLAPVFSAVLFALWSPSAAAQCGACLEICVCGCGTCFTDGPCRSNGPIPAVFSTTRPASVPQVDTRLTTLPNRGRIPPTTDEANVVDGVLPERRRRIYDRMPF